MLAGHDRSRMVFYAWALILALACGAGALQAQGLTGQIAGVVQDPSGAVVVGAKIVLTNTGTAQTRETVSDASGVFVIPELLPGQYMVSVTAPGFKTHEQREIFLTATERVALRPIVLQLGATSESVSVSSEAAKVATQSAERSGLLTTSQVLEAPVIGRNYLSLLTLMPGITNVDNLDRPSGGLSNVKVNGSRGGSLTLNLDGIPNHDTGNQVGPQVVPSMESIAEVKVMASNYQAEYGRSSGATINTVTKAGTREFHGGAYYFKRNESFNANNFFVNRQGLPRSRYRYDYPGYFLGGPVLIPGAIKTRDKLFFFWSQEFLPSTTPTSLGRKTFPTSLERAGDFSQTVDTNGAVISILDPLNNRKPFAGNVIPPSRIDSTGQKLLSLFPSPNTTDPYHTYNYVFQTTIQQPYRFEMLRIDWNISSKTTFYARAHHAKNNLSGDYGVWPVGNSFPGIQSTYKSPARGGVATLIHTFSPALVNELTVGVNSFRQTLDLDLASLNKFSRSLTGFPQFNPQMNPYNVVPNASFGGVQNAPSFSWESRFPFFGTNQIWNLSDNLSRIQGAHNFKAGFYVERAARNSVAWSANQSFMGSADFGRNTNNPLDSNYAFSNAMLGSMNSYVESNSRPISHARYSSIEWFVQDNWRVHKRLTLDIGVRFYHIQPTYALGGQLANFEMSAYDPAKAPLLVQPYKATPSSPRQGRNPATGEILPSVLIGTLAPGSGTFYTGMRSYSEAIMRAPAVSATPRFGFAWDVFGNGKMAVRGGFGIAPGRIEDDRTADSLFQPPVYTTSTSIYTTINDLKGAPRSLSPVSALSVQSPYQPPAIYSYSFGVQRDIGFSTVLDVAYVGSVGRHLQMQTSLNALPYGTNFLPSSIDPTTGTPLPANFLRPIRGFSDVLANGFWGTQNYNSMQTQVNRRFKRNLLYGAAWTWSKVMDLSSPVNPFLNFRMRNYGKGGSDRTHALVLNFDYSTPKLSAVWSNPLTRTVLDNWELAGIVSFISGAPAGLGYSLVSGADLTGAAGSGVDSRVVLTCNPNLARGDRTPLLAFNTSCVAPPTRAGFGIGNAPKDPIRGPGINNWDLSLYKNIPLGKDSARRFQLRAEAYNAFNHTQFTGIDTGGRFDANGNQVNGRFGQYTSAGNPRRLQLGAKFYF